MKKTFGRILSLLLVVSLLIQLVPITIFATESENSTELVATDDAMSIGSADEIESNESTAAPATILFEEESLREESVKHFRMDDGSYIAVQYGTPVHYMDEDGQWVDYDNTLQSVSSLDGSGTESYRVVNGDSVRVFAADANADTLLAVQKGNYGLSLTPIDKEDAELPIVPVLPGKLETMEAPGSEPEVASQNDTVVIQPEETTSQPATILSLSDSVAEKIGDPLLSQAQPEALYSALEYDSAVNGATLRYENYANTIKESIVISAPQADYSYSFRLETDDLNPTIQADGSIHLTSTDGSVIYVIPAPYMIDANKEYSYDAAYTLTGTGSTYTLTVTADPDWLNDSVRAFPVLLDPTIQEITSASNLTVNFVRSGKPNEINTVDKGLYAGYYNVNNTNGLTRSYLHIDELLELPKGCELNQASISIYHYAHLYNNGGAALDVGLYALTDAGNLDGTSSAGEWKSWAQGLSWYRVNNGYLHYDNTIIDKQTLSSSTDGDYVTWDITTLAYKWYDSENYADNLGFMLKAVNEETASSRATFHGPESPYSLPIIMISYRNVRGLEPVYTYQSLPIGRAGVSSISDYSLHNSHVVPLYSAPSNVMPFSLSLVYDSSMVGNYFSNQNCDAHTCNYDTMRVGIGWKLSLQQTVVPLSLGGTNYLVYNDEDGTEHYFYDEDWENNGVTDGIYEEESGLGLKITASGSNYTMTDDYDNTWIFINGYITEHRDIYGNTLYYCYNGNDYSSSSSAWKPTLVQANRVTSVYRKNKDSVYKDANGNTLQAELLVELNYGTSFLQSMVLSYNPTKAGHEEKRTITLETKNDVVSGTTATLLKSIVFPDGARMEYTYFDSTVSNTTYYNRHRLRTVYDKESNYGVEFSYSYLGKVSLFYEYIMDGSNVVYGSKYRAYKRAHSQTAYRYYGKDGIPCMNVDGTQNTGDSGDDLLTVKILDRMGRTTGSYTSNGKETEILGAGAATYTENSGTSKKNNRITSSASAGQQGINLLKNSSAENGTANWFYANVVTTEHYIGDKAFLLGDIGLYQIVSLEAGETYTLSAYVKIPTGTTFSAAGSVHLAFLPLNGNVPLNVGEKVNYTTERINQGWLRLTVSYTPDTAISCRATAMKYGVTAGSVYVDCLQLEKGEAASTYNILEDGSFECCSSIPSATNVFGWNSPSTPTVSTGTAHFGNQWVTFQGGASSIRLNQPVQLALPGNTPFILSGWAKANAKPDSATKITETSKPFFAMLLRLYYSDGTSEPYYFDFDPHYTDWQYRQGIVEAKRGKDITITHGIIVAAYDRNLNSVSFDNFSLRIEPVYSYNYNNNGDPISATGSNTGTTSAEYTGVDPTKRTEPNGNVYTFTYDKHSVITSTIDGVITTNSYDTSGNVTGVSISGSGTSNKIQTSSTISDDRNYTTVSTDDMGNKTQYGYSQYYDTLESATDANGIKTEHSYFVENGRANTSYIRDIAAIRRSYEQGQLKQLERKTKVQNGAWTYQYYNFAFNPWGQTTSISVGNTPLATYAYENVNASSNTGGGSLSSMTYANGDSVTYSYDKFDRPIQTVYNDTGKVVRNYYNAEGGLAKVTYGNGSDSDMNYLFEYDSSGRMIRSTQMDSNQLYLRTEHQYDEFDRLYSQSWSMDGRLHKEQYLYSDGVNGDGSMSFFRASSGQWIYYNYDSLKRMEQAAVKNGSAEMLFKTEYAFKTVEGTRTSTQVESRKVLDAEGNLIKGYKYSYDAVGNITEIRRADGAHNLLYKYAYDVQNQLLSEVHYDENGDTASNITASYSYTYDTAGNLRSESKTVNGETTTKNYSYSTGDWKDLLTAVGGAPIVYEGQTYSNGTVSGEAISGNPIRYTNGTKTYTNLNWQHGRQLASITTGSKTYTYDYDAEGIRTQKVVDGVTHTYYTLNGKVVRESFPYGDTTIIMHFVYDELGKPFGLLYSTNGGSTFSQYYYATNAQGDVEGIFFTKKNAETGVQEVSWMGHYTYDAWGNILSIVGPDTAEGTPGSAITNPANLMLRNPLRYRGYYYDTETGFYYLQSRYYDPVNHRFINADSALYAKKAFDSFAYANLFSYCSNNPVSCVDESGNSWFSKLVAVAATVVVAAVAVTAVVASAGAVACAAGVMACAAGASTATMGAVSIAATVGCYTVAGGIGACALSDSTEILTGTNPIRDYVFGGNQKTYDTIKEGLAICTAGISMMADFARSSGVCFVAGTEVLTDDGHSPIEQICAGELVWAWDEVTGEVALKRVVETYVNETNELVHLFVNGKEIVTTPSHPFYAPTKGWTVACQLRAGDILVTVNGEYVVVEKIQHELLDNPVLVYNFQVEDYHTYYVSSHGILVHNSCNHDRKWDKERRSYLRDRGRNDNVNANYGAYIADEINISRMKRGAAPIGIDGYSVQLHHTNGIANDFYGYVPMTRTAHIALHKEIGYHIK